MRESGGQAGDTGLMLSAKADGKVIDTQKKLGALHVHVVEVTARHAFGRAMPWT